MPITATIPRNAYIAGVNQTVFPYLFPVTAASELIVYAGQTLLTLGVHYTVTGAGLASGGQVVFTAVWAPEGTSVVIIGHLPLSQQTAYVDHQPFPAKAHESALDKLTRITQQFQEAINRTPKLNAFSLNGSIVVDDPIGNGVLRYSADKTRIESFQLPFQTITSPFPPNGTINFQGVGDDATDNAAAFANAIAACPVGGTLFIPPGTYRYSGTIVVGKVMSIVGINSLQTILRPMTPNAPGLSVTSGWVRLYDFQMDRIVQPSVGGDGIVTGSAPLSNLFFSRLLIQKQYRGVQLCPTDLARFDDSTVQFCDSHGIDFDYGTNGAVQWYINNVLTQHHVGDGIHMVNSTATVGVGPFLIECHSFNNTTGYYVHGDAAHAVNDVRLEGCMSSSESSCGIHFDAPYGSLSQIHDCWVELVGNLGPLPKGFLATMTPASHVGNGIRVSGDQGLAPPNIVGGTIWACSWSGLSLESVNGDADSLTIIDCGAAADANLERRAGIVIKANGCHVSGCRLDKSSAGSGQLKGMTVGVGVISDLGIDSSNHFQGYTTVNDMVDTSLATLSGTVSGRFPIGLAISVGRLALTLSDETGGANPSKPIRINNGALEILNNAATQVLFSVDESATANETRLILFDVSAGLAKRVTRGGPDSGGAGFRLLRIVN